jgi:hypothetical protein
VQVNHRPNSTGASLGTSTWSKRVERLVSQPPTADGPAGAPLVVSSAHSTPAVGLHPARGVPGLPREFRESVSSQTQPPGHRHQPNRDGKSIYGLCLHDWTLRRRNLSPPRRNAALALFHARISP